MFLSSIHLVHYESLAQQAARAFLPIVQSSPAACGNDPQVTHRCNPMGEPAARMLYFKWRETL